MVVTVNLSGQGVDFRNDYWLEKAIQIAQIEDKNIFIDTYTPWCGPCKLMDIQFQDPVLAEYFNKRYVNVKINMDSSYGPAIRKKYDVFFLPTLLILDKYGNVKYASEGALTSDELLAIGSFHHNAIYNPELASNSTDFAVANNQSNKPAKKITKNTPPVVAKKLSEPIVSKEKPSTVVTDVVIKEETIPAKSNLRPVETIGPDKSTPVIKNSEKILYTQNDASNDPEFLYNLTYLKLQLQDGSQWAAADKYLETQSDWSTKKNMKFIYDFVRRPGTKMFDYLIKNRVNFDILFGQDNVNRSISIMVNMQLNQGYPRPDFDEAIKLYKLIDPAVADQAAYAYILERYEMEENQEKFVEYAIPYVKNINNNDFAVINTIGMFYENAGNDKITLNEMIRLQEHAISIQGGTYYKLYDTLAGLYFKAGNKKKALNAIEKAMELAKNAGVPIKDIKELQSMIQSL